MKREVNCPYCGESVAISYDEDGGFDNAYYQDKETCSQCGKGYMCITRVTVTHQARKAGCLNGEPHQYKEIQAHPSGLGLPPYRRCVDCGQLALAELVTKGGV